MPRGCFLSAVFISRSPSMAPPPLLETLTVVLVVASSYSLPALNPSHPDSIEFPDAPIGGNASNASDYDAFYYDDYPLGSDLGFICLCETCLARPEWRPPNYDPISNYLWRTGAQPSPDDFAKAAAKSKSIKSNPILSGDAPVLKFGFLVEMHYPFILGSVSSAVEAINANDSILPGVTLDYVFERINKRTLNVESDTIARMTEMRDQGVLAFVGSGFSCKAEALVADAWNLPMFAFQCSDRDLSNKTIYRTFVRTQPPSEKIAKRMVTVLNEFNWNRVVIIWSEHLVYSSIYHAFEILAGDGGIAVNRTASFAGSYLPGTNDTDDMEKLIWETKDVTRVYVFIGDRGALMDFAMLLRKNGLTPEQEYVVLAADVTVDLGERGHCKKYIVPAWGQPRGDMAAVHEAFRAVLLVLPAHRDIRTDQTYHDLVKKIQRESAEEPFCEPHHDLMDAAMVSLEAAFMYDAVKVFALAADDVLKRGGDLRDGGALVRGVTGADGGFTYRSDLMGVDVRIDENGDSEGNYILLAMVDDGRMCNETNTSFLRVGDFDYETVDNQTKPVFKPNAMFERILWPRGRVPPAAPLCGFDGEHCRLSPAVVPAAVVLVSILLLAVGFATRQYRYEQTLVRRLWTIDVKELRGVRPLPPLGHHDSANLPYRRRRRRQSDVEHEEGCPNAARKLEKKRKLRMLSNKDSSLSFGFLLYHNQEYNSKKEHQDSGEAGKANNELSELLRSDETDDKGFTANGKVSCSCQEKGTSSSYDQGIRVTTSLGLDFWRAKTANLQSATFRGNVVVVKRIGKKNAGVDLKNREILKELNTMREIRHENLIPFLGACVAPGGGNGGCGDGGDSDGRANGLDGAGFYVVTPFCGRGGLDDVLSNDNYRLDNMFAASLIADLARGMEYLHNTAGVGAHGNLRSSNCLVDTRWVLQISGFGLRKLRAGEELIRRDGFHFKQKLLWQAPELLRRQLLLRDRESIQHRQQRLQQLLLQQQQQCGEDLAGGKLFSEANLRRSSRLSHHYVNQHQLSHDDDHFAGQDEGADEVEPSLEALRKGDVYAFGIILFEIVGLSGPWGKSEMTGRDVDEVLHRVLNPDEADPLLSRPPVDELECEEYIKDWMRDCWKQQASERPDFKSMKSRLAKLQAGLKPNIFDNMLAIMEKYATNLESQVAERTRLLEEEKKKTDALLYSMLPKTVADCLKQGLPAAAESFGCVTIYFSDVVGFTAISAASTPMQVVTLLNDLYTCFDSIIENYDVYKVETIGDAYMVVSGLPEENGDDHARQIASLALHLLQDISNFTIPHQPHNKLLLRIGIHSGPCVAGVVGRKMPRYCLFGDTVNTASRMETTGEALKIHMSQDTNGILKKIGGFDCQERGDTFIKGKGKMKTYWLLGRSQKCETAKREESPSSNPHPHHPCEVSTQTSRSSGEEGSSFRSSRRRFLQHQRNEEEGEEAEDKPDLIVGLCEGSMTSSTPSSAGKTPGSEGSNEEPRVEAES